MVMNGIGVTGSAVDGYISGATVFADTDGDGIWDAAEAFTTTDANGQYTFGAPVTGPLVLIGGIDISTGNAFAGVLRAPCGAAVCSVDMFSLPAA